MKYIIRIIAVIVTFALFGVTHSQNVQIVGVTAPDTHTLDVELSEKIDLPVWEVDAEIKVLSDIYVKSVFTQETDQKSVEIYLETPIMPNTNYSILMLQGGEGSIDFTTPDDVIWFIHTNVESIAEQDIESMEIIHEQKILLTYREDIIENDVEYKIFAENTVKTVEKTSYESKNLIITLDNTLVSEQSYILMIINIQDIAGEYVDFETGIYDFVTPTFTEPVQEMIDIFEIDTQEDILIEDDIVESEIFDTLDAPEEVVQTENDIMDIEETDIMNIEEHVENEELWEITWDMQEEILLNAAGTELRVEKDIDEVAMSVDRTPDTGSATPILILLTLLINTFYYFARKRMLQTI